MPEKNGTGPSGKGPLTGRGRGKCIIPLNTQEEELSYLESQEIILSEQLRCVKDRIKSIKSSLSGGKK
jgi:predicted RNA-binding protein with EMAP domain